MFEMFATVDSISQTTSIRLGCRSSNIENSFVSSFKIADCFFFQTAHYHAFSGVMAFASTARAEQHFVAFHLK